MISIIVAVYNGEYYIEQCINSILTQKYSNFELIIVNDGSEDNTRKIIEKLQKRDCRINLINIKNAGVSNARNIGIKAAKGKYISFVDADDKIDENIYNDMINIINLKKVDMVMCSYVIEMNDKNIQFKFDWDDKVFYKKEIYDEIILAMLAKIDSSGKYKNLIMGSVWRCLFKKDIIINNNIEFNKDIKISEDLLFVIQYLSFVDSIYTTNNLYYFYNKKTEIQYSTTQKYIDGAKYNFELLNNEILKILNNNQIEESKVWALRIITTYYSLIINECNINNKINIKKLLDNISQIMNESNFDKYIAKLNKNEFYGLKKYVLFCMKKKSYLPIIIYYNYIIQIPIKLKKSIRRIKINENSYINNN